MVGLEVTLVPDIANPRNHSRNAEHDIEFDQENEPIIKVPELNENGTACYGRIGDELSEENKSERLPSRFLAAEPAADWPSEETAAVDQNTQRD